MKLKMFSALVVSIILKINITVSKLSHFLVFTYYLFDSVYRGLFPPTLYCSWPQMLYSSGWCHSSGCSSNDTQKYHCRIQGFHQDLNINNGVNPSKIYYKLIEVFKCFWIPIYLWFHNASKIWIHLAHFSLSVTDDDAGYCYCHIQMACHLVTVLWQLWGMQ